MTRLLRFSLLLVLSLTLRAQSAVIVNEILAHTPSDSTALEWIELYNDSPNAVTLGFYSITIISHGGGSNGFPIAGTIPGESYMVVCRDEALYDVRWGNASGLWGDSPEENYPVTQGSLALTDSSGSAILLLAGQVQSEISWNEPGLQSFSWERVHATSDRIEQAIDPSGSTPGRLNSVSTLLQDLAIEGVEVSSENGLTNLSYTIINRGLEAVNDDTVHLYYYDTLAPDSLGSLIASEAIGPVDTGYTIILIGQYSLPGVYVDLVARLNDDDRNSNNRFQFTAVGQDYPPVILSEFLANPEQSPSREWVELRNRSSQPIDLKNWQLGDSTGFNLIADGSLLIDPGHYVVLVQDSLDFLSYYVDYPFGLIEPASWNQFNNGSDIVVLADRLGFEADRFRYTEVFDGNHTWSRAETGDRAGEWGRSEDAGGTPGEANRVQFAADEDTGLELDIHPRIISPDGDGVDDHAVLTLARPEAAAYTLKIYDKTGRLVKTFEDDLSGSHYSDEYTWDGTNNSYERLPIGIYIVYFEASGVQSLKKTVVIAR